MREGEATEELASPSVPRISVLSPPTTGSSSTALVSNLLLTRCNNVLQQLRGCRSTTAQDLGTSKNRSITWSTEVISGCYLRYLPS